MGELSPRDATELAGFLGGIVGKAHNRQMDRKRGRSGGGISCAAAPNP